MAEAQVKEVLTNDDRDRQWTLPSGTRFKSEDGYWFALVPGETEWKRSPGRYMELNEAQGASFTEVLDG